MGFDENDLKAKGWLSAFIKGLANEGWTDGRNLRVHVRWAAGNIERMRMFAKELVDLQPEVILAHSTPVTASLQRETRTIPIVFVLVGDPVGDGLVVSLPRPGANITGFVTQEATIATKWLELLTEIAPGVKRLCSFSTPTRRLFVGHIIYPHSRPPPGRAQSGTSRGACS
jgi:putative tryptophan/tyrosine transport system substrate-binding protein